MAAVEARHSVAEIQLRALIREEITSQPLNEISLPFAKDSAKNLVQLVVAGAAEYGIAVGSVGAATPIAPVAETAIDALFGIEEVTSGISAVQGVVSSASEMGQILSSAKQSAGKFSTDPKAFYGDIQSAVGKIAAAGATSSLDEIKEQIEKLINEITGPLTAALKMIIPDAVVGAAVAQTVLTAVQSLGTKPYDIMSTVTKKLGKFGRFITDPNAIKEFFNENFPNFVELLKKLAEKLREKEGILKTAAKTAVLGASYLLAKNFGPDVLDKTAAYLTEKQPEIMSVIGSIVDTLIPTVLGLIAAYQSIATGDYKSAPAGSEDSDEAPATAEKAAPAPVSEIRRINRELDRIDVFLESFQGRRLRRSF